jgi:hypothetical protein
LMDVGAS